MSAMDRISTLFLLYSLFISVVFTGTAAYNFTTERPPTAQEKGRCVQEFLHWCNNRKFSGSSSFELKSYDGNVTNIIKCRVDEQGTSCTKNGIQWFACNTKHELTYKSLLLIRIITVDNEICKAKEHALKLNPPPPRRGSGNSHGGRDDSGIHLRDDLREDGIIHHQRRGSSDNRRRSGSDNRRGSDRRSNMHNQRGRRNSRTNRNY